MLSPELPYFDEKGGEALPPGIDRVADTHVHVFPDRIFSAVWAWFDRHAWKVRYRMPSQDLIRLLLDRGVDRVVALQYAHKPGMAQFLNQYMADLVRQFPGRLTGLATCFPGEPDVDRILAQAFDMGLSGVKLHAHVQCFDMADDALVPVYEQCQRAGKPLIMHVGREPKSPAYPCDPYQICRADKLEQVLNRFPELKVCVPHLGFDEIAAYKTLIETHENLWLDTAMVLADYFPEAMTGQFSGYRLDRVMYGSDYPNIPYAWDRELKRLVVSPLSKADLDQVLYRTAMTFYDFQG